MRGHRRSGFRVAHWEGANVWSALAANRRERVAQQLIGALVLQGDFVEGAPADEARQRFDQGIGGEDLAGLVEDECRYAQGGERFAGGAGSFELQSRRDQDAAGEVGTQGVEPASRGAVEGTAIEAPRQNEGHVFAGRNRDCSGHSPSNALRTPDVAIDRLAIKLFGCEKVDVDQKSGDPQRKQLRDDLSAPQPAFPNYPFGARARLGRSGPVLNIALRDEQRRSGGVSDSADLIENVRPCLRRETTLVDPVDERRIHELSNSRALLAPQVAARKYHGLPLRGNRGGRNFALCVAQVGRIRAIIFQYDHRERRGRLSKPSLLFACSSPSSAALRKRRSASP